MLPGEIYAHNLPSMQSNRIYAVISQSEFEEYFQSDPGLMVKPHLVAISITDPDESYPQVPTSVLNGFKDFLQLKFWDLEEDCGRLKIISAEDGQRTRDFVEKNKDSTFVLHCRAGQSRSAGVAMAIECLLDYNGDAYAYATGHSYVKEHMRYSPNLTVRDVIV